MWTIFVLLMVLWILLLIAKVGGTMVHLLLLAALAILMFRLISHRRAVP
jgi:hypothetical protein